MHVSGTAKDVAAEVLSLLTGHAARGGQPGKSPPTLIREAAALASLAMGLQLTVGGYGLTRILAGLHSPLRVAVPVSNMAGAPSTIVSNLRSDPQSLPQSRDR